MKKRLIINLITLSFTALLLVFLALAWYVENKMVSANNILGQSAGDEYTLRLERGKFKYGLTPAGRADYYWEWTDTRSMTFSDIQPGDVFYFRIVLNTDGTQEFTLKFDEVTSSLIEDSLYGYINSSLVEYEKTSDTTAQTGKQYYSGSFTQATVTTGDDVKPYTYYVFNSTNKEYSLTTDTTFQSGTTYYKAKFLLDEIPNFALRTYYTKKAVSTTPNAIGYKYSSTPVAYNYMYPLYSDNTVKVKSGTKSILYEYDSTENEVTLKDYLIEDVIKVYDIGTTYIDEDDEEVGYGTDFIQNDSLIEYVDSAYVETEDTTYNSKKTYYYYHPTFGYVKLAGTTFTNGVQYYELDTTKSKSLKYSTNGFLKSVSFDFDTEFNDEGTSYYYFALEFNDAASLVSIDGVESSNCYLHQVLSINNLIVEMKKNDN